MNEEYLQGYFSTYVQPKVKDVTYEQWVEKIKDNDQYKQGMFNTHVAPKAKDVTYENWNTKVFGSGGGASANFTQGSSEPSGQSTPTTSTPSSEVQSKQVSGGGEKPSDKSSLFVKGQEIPVGVATEQQLINQIKNPYEKEREQLIYNATAEYKQRLSELPYQQAFDSVFAQFAPLIQQEQQKLQQRLDDGEITEEDANKELQKYYDKANNLTQQRLQANPKLVEETDKIKKDVFGKLEKDIAALSKMQYVSNLQKAELEAQAKVDALSPMENLGNFLANEWVKTKMVPAQTTQLASQVTEDFEGSGKAPHLVLDKDGFSVKQLTPQESQIENFKATEALKAELQPTKGVVESVEQGDYVNALAAVAGNSMSFLSSMLRARLTGGLSIGAEIAEPMWTDAVKAKAQLEGKTPEEIIAEDAEDELTTFALAAPAVLLEQIGFKAGQKMIKSMSSPIGKAALTTLKSSTTETITELGQGDIEKINSALQEKGTSIMSTEAAKQVVKQTADYFTSKDALETGVSTFLGSTVLGYGGVATKSLVKMVAKDKAGAEKISELTEEELGDILSNAEEYKAKLSELYANGYITEDEKKSGETLVDEVLGTNNALSDKNPAKVESIKLIAEREKKKAELESLDETQRADKQLEIDEINKQLELLANGQTKETQEGAVRDKQEKTPQTKTDTKESDQEVTEQPTEVRDDNETTVEPTKTEQNALQQVQGETKESVLRDQRVEEARKEEPQQTPKEEKPSEEAKVKATEYGYNHPIEAVRSVNRRLGTDYLSIEEIPDADLNKAQKSRLDENIDNIIQKVKDRVSDKADPTKVNDRAFNDALEYLQTSKWYESATDKQREAAVIDLMKKTGQKIRRTKTPEGAMELVYPEVKKKVTMTEIKALGKQIKDFARGMKEGAKAQRVTAKDVQKFISDLDISGKVSPQQLNAIAKRAANVNFGSEKSVNDFVDYAKKVATDSEYAQKLSDAQKAKVKTKKLSKSKALPVNLRNRLEEFARLDPKYIDDINLYNDVADKLLQAAASPTSKKYKPLNDSDIEGDLTILKGKMERGEINRLLEDNPELEEVGFTLDELQQFLESESADEYLNNLTEAKRKALRDKMQTIAEYSQVGMDEHTLPRETSAKNKERFDALKNIDLKTLTVDELRDFIRVADNIINNNNFDGVVPLAAKSVAQQQANDMMPRLKNKDAIRDISKLASESLSFQGVFRKIFGLRADASVFQTYSGIQDFFNSIVTTANQMYKIEQRYDKKIKSIKKRNKNISSYDQNVFRAVIATAVQEGTVRIEETLNRLKNDSDKSAQKEYEVLKEQYDKIKDLKTPQEIIKYVKGLNDGNYDLLKFWSLYFQSIRDELKSTKEEVHNEKFEDAEVLDGWYFPIDQVKYLDTAQDIDDGTAYHISPTKVSKPKAAPSTISRQKKPSLRKGYKLNTQFDSAMFKRAKQDLVDINSSENIAIMREFMSNKNVVDLIGARNIDRITKLINGIIDSERNIVPSIPEIHRAVGDLFRVLRKMGYTSTLATGLQVLKQGAPVLMNTALNLGKDSYLMFQASPKQTPLTEKYTIGQRGKNVAGLERGDTLNAAQKKEIVGTLDQVIRKAELGTEAVRDFLFTPLRATDTAAAVIAWKSFYLKYLKDNGYDISKVDFDTEHINMSALKKEAASYAEQQVNETQVPSLYNQLPTVIQTGNAPLVDALKNALMPYSTFSIVAKGRMYNDMSIILDRGQSSESKKEALKSMLGTMSEIAVFGALSVYVVAGIREMGKDFFMQLFDVDMDDDEQDRIDALEFKWKKFYSNALRDLVVGGFGGVTERVFIDALNELAFFMGKLFEWDEYQDARGNPIGQKEYDEIKPFYRYGDESMDYGLYGVFVENVWESVNTLEVLLAGETVTIETKYGHKEVTLTEDQRDYLKFTLVMETLNTFGFNDPELARMAQSGKREILQYESNVKKQAARIRKQRQELSDKTYRLLQRLADDRVSQERFDKEFQKLVEESPEIFQENLFTIISSGVEKVMEADVERDYMDIATTPAEISALFFADKFGEDLEPKEIQKIIKEDAQFQALRFSPSPEFFLEYERLKNRKKD